MSERAGLDLQIRWQMGKDEPRDFGCCIMARLSMQNSLNEKLKSTWHINAQKMQLTSKNVTCLLIGWALVKPGEDSDHHSLATISL